MSKTHKDTRFLFDQNAENCKVVIYGAGRAGKDAFLTMNNCMQNIEVIAVLDDNRINIHGLEHLGNFVKPLSKMPTSEYDYFVIAAHTEELWHVMKDKAIQNQGINPDKILVYFSPTPRQLIFPRISTIPFVNQRIYMLLEKMIIEGDKCKGQVEDELKALANIIKHEIIWLNYREWHTDEKKQCAYLQMPKVASTSLTKTIRKIGDTHGLLVSDIEGETRYRYRLPDDFNGFKFTFVRNPFARTVSCYRNRVEGREIAFFRYYKLIGLEKDYGFENYVKAIANVPDEWAERHFASQYFQAYENGKCIVDFVGRFENLNDDYEWIRKRYDLEPLEHRNASSKYDYRDFYTEELAELVYRRYKIDFETFGYKEEYVKLLDYIREKKRIEK